MAKLGLSKKRMSDYCQRVERHPHLIAPAPFGDFIGAFMDTARIGIPLSEALPKPSMDMVIQTVTQRLLKSFLLSISRRRR